MLCLKCKGQVVSIDVDERIADKHINANTVHWEFCERWDGMTITAQFTQGEKTYDVLVDEVTKTTTLPNELVAGDVDISAFGEHPVTKVRITTVPVKKRIDKSGFVGDGETPIPPTPDLYSQLIDKVNKTAIPHIGANGNWWFDDEDSGVDATAELEEVRDEAIAAVEHTKGSIPPDYTTLAEDVGLLKDTKASAIIDKSANAAGHDLHIQPSSNIGLKLYGKTWWNTEEKKHSLPQDPDFNLPAAIYGVDQLSARTGGKNLLSALWCTQTQSYGFQIKNYADGTIHLWGTHTRPGYAAIFTYTFPFPLPPGRYTLSANNPLAFSTATGSNYNILLWFRHHNHSTYVPQGGIYMNQENKTATFEVSMPITEFRIRIGENVEKVESFVLRPQLEYGSVASPFELYDANVMNAPINGTLPLYGNDTIKDTLETDVLSGCDVKKIINSADDLMLDGFDAAANVVYSDTTPNIVVTDGIIVTELPYPTCVYYRSTQYTPRKDLRVCKVTRHWKTLEMTGKINDGWYHANGTADGEAYYRLHIGEVGRYKNSSSSLCSHIKNAGSTVITTGNKVKGFSHLASSSSNAHVLCVRDNNTWATVDAFIDDLKSAASAATPVKFYLVLSNPEITMTDSIPQLEAIAIGLKPEMVIGSGETEVTYAHDTKHYIDEKFAALSAALIGG